MYGVIENYQGVPVMRRRMVKTKARAVARCESIPDSHVVNDRREIVHVHGQHVDALKRAFA